MGCLDNGTLQERRETGLKVEWGGGRAGLNEEFLWHQRAKDLLSGSF